MQYPVEFSTSSRQGKTVLTAKVLIPRDNAGDLIQSETPKIVNFINSYELRNVAIEAAPEHGCENQQFVGDSSSAPMLDDPDDRTSALLGYTRDFMFKRSDI